jgi:rfaE bifunctional protein nucleotidyltransferase chain/domain
MSTFVKSSAPPSTRPQNKILSLEALKDYVRQAKAEKKSIVHCHGTFDLLHPGHIRYFEAAKKEGDCLVVTVTADRCVKKGLGKPVFREQLRAESIAALQCIDAVAIDPHETSEEVIRLLQPDVYAKGSDYEGREREPGHPTAVENTLVQQYGGRLHFTHDPVTFSSTALLNDHFSSKPASLQTILREVRQTFSDEEFTALFERMRSLRVLVIGDAILDVYHYSNFMGRSVKEEIPRVKVLGSDMFPGGSLAVANTLAGFCDSVGLLTMLGGREFPQEQDRERFIRDHLHKNIAPTFLYRHGAPTVINERFVNNEPYLVDEMTKVKMRKYFGVYRLNEDRISPEIEEELVQTVPQIAAHYDVVIVTDYGLGMLTESSIKAVADVPAFLAINTQTNSMNYGFNLITKYPRADYVSISLPEMRLALHDQHANPDRLAEKLTGTMHIGTVAITLGALGIFLRDKNGSTSIPALTTNVVDNIGAGDAFLALSSLAVSLGTPRVISGFLGAAAAAQSCGIIANKRTVDRPMLLRTIHGLLKSNA